MGNQVALQRLVSNSPTPKSGKLKSIQVTLIQERAEEYGGSKRPAKETAQKRQVPQTPTLILL